MSIEGYLSTIKYDKYDHAAQIKGYVDEIIKFSDQEINMFVLENLIQYIRNLEFTVRELRRDVLGK